MRRGSLRVRVSKAKVAAAPAAAETHATSDAGAGSTISVAGPDVAKKQDFATVNAPLTGIFYRSPSPQAPAFIQIGGQVNNGDVIGLIEAMKLFNEIRATASGTVRRILIENGQLVRAHQPIIELE